MTRQLPAHLSARVRMLSCRFFAHCLRYAVQRNTTKESQCPEKQIDRALPMSLNKLKAKSNVKRYLLSAVRNASCESISLNALRWSIFNKEADCYRYLDHRLRMNVCRTGFSFDRQRRSWLLMNGESEGVVSLRYMYVDTVYRQRNLIRSQWRCRAAVLWTIE